MFSASRAAGSWRGETATCCGSTERLVQYRAVLTTPRPRNTRASFFLRFRSTGCSHTRFGFCFGLRAIFLTAFTHARRDCPSASRPPPDLKGRRTLSGLFARRRPRPAATASKADSNERLPDIGQLGHGKTRGTGSGFHSGRFVRTGSHRSAAQLISFVGRNRPALGCLWPKTGSGDLLARRR
jgi:hypothetical protein